MLTVCITDGGALPWPMAVTVPGAPPSLRRGSLQVCGKTQPLRP